MTTLAWHGPAPEVLFLQVAFEIARVRAGGADVDNLGDLGQPGRLHQVRAHDQVRVVELGRLALVDADAAVVGGGVKQQVARMLEQAPQAGVERDQIVIALAGHEDPRAVAFEPLDHMLAKKPAPPVTVMRLPDQKLFICCSDVRGQWSVVRCQVSVRRRLSVVESAGSLAVARQAPKEPCSAVQRKLSNGLRTTARQTQTLANGFWNSISRAARTSSAMPRSRSIVVSKPFLRIFSYETS